MCVHFYKIHQLKLKYFKLENMQFSIFQMYFTEFIFIEDS